MANVIDVETIMYDESFDPSSVGQLALCLTLDEAKELAGVLEWSGDKKFAPALRKWIDSPYRNKGKEN